MTCLAVPSIKARSILGFWPQSDQNIQLVLGTNTIWLGNVVTESIWWFIEQYHQNNNVIQNQQQHQTVPIKFYTYWLRGSKTNPRGLVTFLLRRTFRKCPSNVETSMFSMTESVQYRLRPTQSTAMLSSTIRPVEKTYNDTGQLKHYNINHFDLMFSV